MSGGALADTYHFVEEPAARPNLSPTSVQFATRVSDGLAVAVKARSRAVAFDGDVGAELRWLKEMRSQLGMPKSSAICELVEVVQTSSHYHVVMKKVEGRTLRAWQSGSQQLKPTTVRQVIKQVLQGLAEMHASQRMHRKLGFESVMVNIVPAHGETSDGSQATATLIGLDDSATWKQAAPKETRLVGARGFMAPEAYQGRFSPSSDVYSVGAIMYKLLTRKFVVPAQTFDVKLGEGLVGSESARRIYKRLQEAELDFSASPASNCPAAAALCRSLLAFRSEERPSAQDALAHEWFALGDSLLEPHA